MSRGASAALLGALFLVGGSAGIFVAGGSASSEAPQATSRSEAITRVTVTAADSKFRLSRRSAPTGRVIFMVTNKGKVSHDFKIAGKKTPLLTPGHSATLRVAFSKKGRYPYLSTVSGQAAAGMKGIFVVVAPTPPTTSTTPSTASTTTTRSVTPRRRSPSNCSFSSSSRHLSSSRRRRSRRGWSRSRSRTSAPINAVSTSRASGRGRYSTRVSRRRGRWRSPRASTTSIATRTPR